MNIETLEDLFAYRLQHAYYAERTHAELLAEMAADAENDELAERFATHRDETERHVDRLEDVFAELGRRPAASRTRMVDGLAESRRMRRESDDGPPPTYVDLEIGLTAERLECRAYEALLTLAGRLAYADEIVDPLETNLSEERDAIQALEDVETETPIAESIEEGAP